MCSNIQIMCLIFLAINQHPDYPLIIAANRDEFYSRPSESAHFWPEHPQILAGKDNLAGGTWLGITRQGRFAAVTNYREMTSYTGTVSRGNLVSDFLTGRDNNNHYTQKLVQTAGLFSGFNCLYGTLSPAADLHYFSNRQTIPQHLGTGIYGLSNGVLDSGWPKVTRGKQHLRSLLSLPFHVDNWLELLANRQIAGDSELPDTGIGQEKEQLLSPIFISSANYGTRCSTVIAIDDNNIVSFTERTFKPGGTVAGQYHFNFEIKPA